MKIDEELLLQIVRDEQVRAIGFDNETTSEELMEKRRLCIEYFYGEMRDLPPHKGRSAAKSTDVADGIRHALPMIVEVFEEEDIASFRPNNEADMDAAAQATEYINHVFFKQNRGFQALHDTIMDALLTGNGYMTVRWEEPKEPQTQDFKNMGLADWINAKQFVDQGKAILVSLVENPPEDPTDPQATPTYNYTLQAPQKEGRAVVEPWNSGDVAVSVDTIHLGDGVYCGFRRRCRRFELLDEGYDADIVENLPHAPHNPTLTDYARDRAGEWANQFGSASDHDMETVEIFYNYVRMPGVDKLVHVVTAGEHILKPPETVNSVPAACFRPFPNPFRHFNDGLAWQLIETQRQKTSVLRLGLDSAHYGMIGRVTVNQSGTTQHTIDDLINQNVPGGIVRVKAADTVQPIQTAPLSFDPFQSLEYLSTAGEQTSGVSRASMGLNADSLHETKGGMLALLNASQTRIRFMARCFAEGGFRDLMLRLYEVIRKNATMAQMVRLEGKFVAIDPTDWDARDDIDIEIANAGGRDVDVAALSQILTYQEKIAQQQGGLSGPIINAANVSYALNALTKRMGRKDADQLWAAPQQAQAQAQAQQASQNPKPDPAMQKVQADIQLAQARHQSDMQLAQSRQQSDAAMDAQKAQLEQAQTVAKLQADKDRAQSDIQIQMAKIQSDADLERYRIDQEMALKRWQVEQELQLKQAEIAAQIQLDAQTAGPNPVPPVYPGGNQGG